MSKNPIEANISQTSVINISRLFEPDESADIKLDQKIVDALQHQGSFVCVGYPGWEGLEQRARCITEFFDLPNEIKLSIATQKVTAINSNRYRGYYPPPKVRGWLDKERLDIGPEPPLEVPLLQGGTILREYNCWPAIEPYDGWRQECLAYFAQIREITVALMDAIARGLGLDNVEFKRLYCGRNGTVRLLNYLTPPTKSDTKTCISSLEMVEDGRRWIIGQEHVDTTVLTLLWQNKKGLQMKDLEGQWRDVPVVPGGLSLHCGDIFNRLTNGVINAARHRVVGDGGSRTSLAMFLEPDWATKVDPPDTNAPLTYAAHLLNIFSARLEKQKKTPK